MGRYKDMVRVITFDKKGKRKENTEQEKEIYLETVIFPNSLFFFVHSFLRSTKKSKRINLKLIFSFTNLKKWLKFRLDFQMRQRYGFV